MFPILSLSLFYQSTLSVHNYCNSYLLIARTKFSDFSDQSHYQKLKLIHAKRGVLKTAKLSLRNTLRYMSHSSYLLPNSLNLYLCLLQLFHDVHRVSLGLQWLSQDSLTLTQPAVK